jgi:hypothetical protein
MTRRNLYSTNKLKTWQTADGLNTHSSQNHQGKGRRKDKILDGRRKSEAIAEEMLDKHNGRIKKYENWEEEKSSEITPLKAKININNT